MPLPPDLTSFLRAAMSLPRYSDWSYRCTDACDSNCVCSPGYGYDRVNNRCPECQQRTYSSAPSLQPCITCESCTAGQYRAACGGTDAGACLQCQTCPAGSILVGCSGTSPGECTPCSPGTFQLGSICQPCPSNTYQAMVSQI